MRKRSFSAMLMMATACFSQAQERGPMHHVQGTFTVEVKPLTPAPAEGVSRYTINKQLRGGLEGTTQGEMFSAGDPQHGHAGYVAIERVTGTLEGKHGSFVLQHLATMDANGPQMTVQVVPGSGTDELKGISGRFVISVEKGEHSYVLDYELPAQH